MRYLTITRHKSFVACAATDHVYIADPQSTEITIAGVPCRKLGVLKNGQQQTFLIGDEVQQIFLISGKLTRNLFYSTLMIPAGQENVALSGKHHFVLGSNPFRFDGIPPTPQQKALEKKQARKGIAILIVAVVLGWMVGGFIGRQLFSPDKPKAKTFTKEDFSITLTDEFEEATLDGFYAAYESPSAAVFTLRESKFFFGDISLEEYVQLVFKANGQIGMKANSHRNMLWFSYEKVVDGRNMYYMAFCCEGEDAFWLVQFVTPSTNKDDYTETFLKWAESIRVEATEKEFL